MTGSNIQKPIVLFARSARVASNGETRYLIAVCKDGTQLELHMSKATLAGVARDSIEVVMTDIAGDRPTPTPTPTPTASIVKFKPKMISLRMINQNDLT